MPPPFQKPSHIRCLDTIIHLLKSHQPAPRTANTHIAGIHHRAIKQRLARPTSLSRAEPITHSDFDGIATELLVERGR